MGRKMSQFWFALPWTRTDIKSLSGLLRKVKLDGHSIILSGSYTIKKKE